MDTDILNLAVHSLLRHVPIALRRPQRIHRKLRLPLPHSTYDRHQHAPRLRRRGNARHERPILPTRHDQPALPRLKRQLLPPALEEVMATFSALDPALRGSGVIFEAFSLQAVQRVPAASTAYPDRENGVLMASFQFWNATGLMPEREREIEEMAFVAGREMRDSLLKGAGGRLNAYVNYAHGDEGLEAMYGYESWRVERLRGLKRVWDPEGRFGWYAPIE